MRTIQQSWEEYKKAGYPKGIPAKIKPHMKMAFLSGAISAATIIVCGGNAMECADKACDELDAVLDSMEAQ